MCRVLPLLLCMVVVATASLHAASSAALLNKRLLSFGYGVITNEHVASSIESAHIGMQLPLAKKATLGFGTSNSWTRFTENDIEYDQREHRFYTNLTYQFLPKAVINPFITLELGHLGTQLTNRNTTSSNTNRSSLLYGGSQNSSLSNADTNMYMAAAIGEEFLFAPKLSSRAYYQFGQVDEASFQRLFVGIGYWVLEDFFLDAGLTIHFDTAMSQFHVVGRLRF